MNIIKLQDKIMPVGCDKAEFFNNKLKGKYAYWIRMRYIIPFDTMSYNGYVACEEDINKLLKDSNGEYPRPYGCEYLDLYDHIVDLYDNSELNILEYIDSAETDHINDINQYVLKNSYITDEDITLDEIKKFRTWLASELLLFDTEYTTGEYKNEMYTSQESHVLQYYKYGMVNEITSGLIDFGGTVVSYNTINKGCGCSGSSDLSSLYNNSISSCEPINIYKRNIYNKMVDMFSNIEFWMKYPKEFISTFKKYIDNIIKVGLVITDSRYVSKYTDCACISSNKQEDVKLLERLSNALNYIYMDDIVGHKNYIKDALYDWASTLYEQMEW